jgi:hypothetical protein
MHTLSALSARRSVPPRLVMGYLSQGHSMAALANCALPSTYVEQPLTLSDPLPPHQQQLPCKTADCHQCTVRKGMRASGCHARLPTVTGAP